MDIIENLENGFANPSKIREQLFNVESVQLVPVKEGFNVPTAFGIYKTDGGDPLGVVGKDFTATQPHALFDGLVDCGVDLSKATFHELKGGSKIYFDIPITTIAFKNSIGLGDATDASIRIQTGFDGKTVTSLYVYTHRLICSNGMKMSQTEFSARFKNTSGNQGKVISLCHDVNKVIESIDHVKDLYIELDKTQITQKTVDEYLARVVNIDKAIQSEWSTRKTNMYNEVMGSINLEFGRSGSTAYGLLQGITHYTNHKASGSGSDEYILCDTGSKINDKAMKFVTGLV